MMLKIDFDAGGSMPGGSYIPWQPCTYPRDAKGKWLKRTEIISPNTTTADATDDDDDLLGLRTVRVKFTFRDSWAKDLLLVLAKRHRVKRYYHEKMPFLTVVLVGPEDYTTNLVVEYSRTYDKLSDLLRDTTRKFFNHEFGIGYR